MGMIVIFIRCLQGVDEMTSSIFYKIWIRDSVHMNFTPIYTVGFSQPTSLALIKKKLIIFILQVKKLRFRETRDPCSQSHS